MNHTQDRRGTLRFHTNRGGPIEHQLAHAVKDANGRAYNRTSHLEGRAKMMQGWADYLDALKAQAQGGNVVVGQFQK